MMDNRTTLRNLENQARFAIKFGKEDENKNQCIKFEFRKSY